MPTRLAKLVPIAVCTILLCIVLTVGILNPSSQDKEPLFKIGTGTSSVYIKAWLDSTDSCYYLFVPSYATLDSITYDTPKLPLTIGNTVINKGDNLATLDTGTTYPLLFGKAGTRNTGKFRIVRSGNVATMFIDINENLLDKIHASKGNRGRALMTLISPSGAILHEQTSNPISLQCRGNSTFEYIKKPYLISLPYPDTLLGMPPATKWNLLANALDESNLKNKIVLDFSNSLGYCWSPKCEYVDLYINHSYYGLYLLTETIELAESKLHPDTYPQYLIVTNHKEPHTFCPRDNQYVSLVNGNISQADSLQDELERLYTAIFNADTTPSCRLEGVIDIHSWACKYLTDEIFANHDMWRFSHYLYCSGERPFVFYGGPAWDYDLSWRYPTNSFIAYKHPELTPYPLLMQNKTFETAVVGLYRTYGRHYMEWLSGKGIDSLASIIHNASQANSIRWYSLFHDKRPHGGWIQESMPSPDSLKTFLSQRSAFLDRHWLQGRPYEHIFIDLGFSESGIWAEYEPGHSVSHYINQSHMQAHFDTLTLRDTLSGKIYTLSSIVDTVVCLTICRQPDDTPAEPAAHTPIHKRSWSAKKILSTAIVTTFVLLFILMCGLSAKEFLSNRKEGDEN